MGEPEGQAPGKSGHRHAPTGRLLPLVLGSVGVVYGDIGTSPLYAMRASLHALSRDGLTRDDVVGVISLLIRTLILIGTIKYVIVVMRADSRVEGGTLSLVALLQQALGRRRPCCWRWGWWACRCFSAIR